MMPEPHSPTQFSPAQFSPAQCAAVFVMLLDDDAAAGLLARLSPDELERVGSTMCALGDIAPDGIAHAIAGFVAQAEDQTLESAGSHKRFGTLLDKAFDEVRSTSLMQRILPDGAPRSIELARWLAPPILARLIEEEHPQVIAVLLLLIEPEDAAQVLAQLPSSAQPAVVERVARLGEVPTDAVDMLDRMLSRRITQKFGASALKLGGAREAASLINLANPDLAKQIIPAIEARDHALARAIEAEMFTFEMLLELEPQAMGRLLRDCDNQHLITALKGLSEDQQAPFFAAMSSRAADGVRDEIELLPRLRREEVIEAQKAIVDLARTLAEQGDIQLGASDGEFV